ncbi:phe operon leader peptide [Escherichia coli]|nr:phe operon leader peptide [Escherichia coli]EFC1505127.1 phe operon leader peptide [Escherichia coli]EIY7235213.1 phe operon leader peptide [Escherichia coli]MCZ0264905.1 phe operon leader peptide [Escherichia coli]MCZ0347728.1 phe operon leader peptide [Escherichia coli]
MKHIPFFFAFFFTFL